MKNKFVTDTMALVLRLEKRRMGRKAKGLFQAAENGEILILVPAMVLAEIGYLSEKKKIDTSLQEFMRYSTKYNYIKIKPVDENVIMKSFEIDDIIELHDRIIAGTGFLENSPVITNDPMIENSRFVSTIW